MYVDFYGLKSLPFQLTPDASFYFESSVHAKAMAHLKYGLHQAEGFIVITGDIGAGKTTLVERLCASLNSERYVIAKITSTQTSADDILRMVAAGFGIKAESLNKGDLITRFESAVLAHFQAGRRLLLLVDEAQNLSPAALEELRMLSNFIVGSKAPMQSFLLGQPQFRTTLALCEMEQLRQRILASYHLGPLGPDETKAYIEHRLCVAGWQSDPHFTDDGLFRIHALTKGIPRRINMLCSRLMLFAYLEETHIVDARTVIRVSEEMDIEVSGPSPDMKSAREAPTPIRPAGKQAPSTWSLPLPHVPLRGPITAIPARW